MAKRIKRNPNQALIYIRVSSEKQSVSGLGLADQTNRCRAYCEMMGLQVVELFRDDTSAGKPLAKRPAGARLLDTLKRSGAGAVVTLKLDRAFRSAVDALVTVEQWEQAGVALHMVDFGGNS
ncbi:MAG: recombinase family protein, partial [Nitrospinaceae bacterium]|nr:recombinase family protein [Nitrospinaceae bacterium]